MRRLGTVLIGALILQLYAPTLLKLIAHWSANDMYSYAFAVPVICVAMLWLRRGELAATPVQPRLVAGTVVLGSGVALLLAGRLSSTNLVEELSFVVTICGVTLLLFGWKVLRATAFPIAYLLAMIPFWDFLTVRIHPHFQLYSAAVGVGALRLFGVPVWRDGFIIELPYTRLEVAEACSGVNYLIAVLCIGVAATYVFVRGWPKRVFVVSAAVLIALLSNGLRVAMVAFFAYAGIRGENGDIHGPYALFRSLLISGVGYAVLFALVMRFSSDASDSQTPDSPQPTGFPSRTFAPAAMAPLVAAVAILCVPTAVSAVRHVGSVPLQTPLAQFPHTIGEWQAEGPATLTKELEQLEFDHRLSRLYRAPDGTELNLLIGYFEKQNQGKELAGYAIREALGGPQRSTYPLPHPGARQVNDVVTTIQNDTFHTTYWYALNGGMVTDDLRAKAYTAWNSIAHGRSEGSLIVIRTRVLARQPLDQTRRRVGDFASRVVDESKEFLPW